MNRMTSSALAVLLVAGCYVRTQAAENTGYRVNVTATQSGNEVTVATEVLEVTADGLTETLSRPRIMMRDGQQGKIFVGERDDKDQESGFHLQIIKAKGKAEVLVVSSVLENGEIVWAEAKSVKVEKAKSDSVGAGGGLRGGRSGSSGLSATSRPARVYGGGGGSMGGRNAINWARVEVEWKYRRPAGQGEWHEGTSRLLTGAPAPLDLWEVNGIVYELTNWDGKSASIKGMNGRLVPAEPGDFDAAKITAPEGAFKSNGQVPYPMAVGKVFAVQYGGPEQGGVGEALIRIRSIQASSMTLGGGVNK